MNTPLSLSTTVTLIAHRAGLHAGRDNEVEVLVRIDAPDMPAGHVAQRPLQALALVIDRSGSMQGHPLDEAKRCAAYVVGQLRPTDKVSLVQFDNRVRRLWPAVPLGDGAALREAIAAIHSGGQTNLHGGWLEGADSLRDVGGSGLKRVILLSDGQANAGLTDPVAIAAQCTQQAAQGVTTSTYGLGRGFNEDLMVAMARAGGGNHYYGDTAEDLMDPFQQELELLGNLCLRELHLSVDLPGGVTVKMINDLPRADGGWRMLDLTWGAQAWAVLRLTVPAAALPAAGQWLSLLQVSMRGRTLDGEAVTLERTSLALRVLPPDAFSQLAEDDTVARRLVELAAADALTRMRQAAFDSDWVRVDDLLQRATLDFADNDWVAAVLDAMKAVANSRSRERMMKESMYSSAKMRSRLTSRDEDQGFSAAQGEAATPSYLRRKSAQGKAAPGADRGGDDPAKR